MIVNEFLLSKKIVFTRSAIVLITLFLGLNSSVYAEEITCSTTSEIVAAMGGAVAGDIILIEAGTYISDDFETGNAGTNLLPITIKSKDPNDQAILKGTSLESGHICDINHEYWIVQDLVMQYGNKGLILDNASYSIVDGITLSNTGQEGIHVINGSSNIQILNCKVTDCGNVKPEYGEAVYVGSDYKKWIEEGGAYAKECDDVLIQGCELGPDVSAEHVDIKEGTLRTIVENCVFYGGGMSGENGGGSFIDAKGDSCIIRNNTGYRQGNIMVVAAFENHVKNDWGNTNLFCSNTVDMDIASIPIVNGSSGQALVSNNLSSPSASDPYVGNCEQVTLDCDNARDCEGVLFGTAIIDDCDNCVEGTTGEVACSADCNGDWGGTAAIDSCGVCSGGNTGIEIDDCVLSANDLGVDNPTVYPNPTTGIIHLQMESLYKVTTITGLQILTGFDNRIDLSSQPAGLYFVFVEDSFIRVVKE